MGRLITIIFLSLVIWHDAHAQGNQNLWKSASEQYANGDFTTAAINYKIIEQDNVVSSELYFNLGNCYYQLDSIAKSILYFEKAIKLNPRDREARENLALVKKRIDDPIPSIDQFFLMRWLNWTSELLPPMGWGILSMLLLWSTLWILVRSAKRHTFQQDRLRYGLPVVVFIFCLFIGYISYQNQTESEYAIVMESISVTVAPDELSPITRTVGEGEKVMIIDKLDDYYKVRFVNYEHGWLPVSAIARI